MKKTKKTISQENDDLKFWITYIDYRAKHYWTGRPSQYCITDLQNIIFRIKNDLFESDNSF